MAAQALPPLTQVIPATPLLFVFETQAGVQSYFKRNFGHVCRLRLFSEEQELRRELDASQKPSVLLLAWDGSERSLPLFSHVRAMFPDLPVVLLVCSTNAEDYEIFARFGHSGIVWKPFVDGQLERQVEKHLTLATYENKDETQEIPLDGNRSFVRSSKRMREIESQALLVARSDIPVLILGESGTGKEVIALYTHKMSRRSKQIFLKVNCAAMPAELLESELFGYEQGAFTGAIRAKPGKFEICNGGTIFLDEIGEMPAILQAKLLQVLQDGTFSRLGSRAPTRCDVRVIAATNINMKEAMAQKTFREDLYYRLNGLSLHLPPLRQRIEEIPSLASYFMRRGAAKYDLLPLAISPCLLAALTQYSWPGNLRELENVMNRLLILQDERAIIADLCVTKAAAPTVVKVLDPIDEGGLKQMVRGIKGEAESAAIASVLEETGWNRKAAASDLQISYKALLYKIKQYDLSPRMV